MTECLSSTFRSPARIGLSWLKSKAAMARVVLAGLQCAIAVQDRFNICVMAAGTKVVDGIYACARFVDQVSSGRFPKRVAREFIRCAFQVEHFVAKISYRLTKGYIRLSRTCYLLSQVSNGFSDLIHWRRLRRLKNRLESVNCTYGRIERRGPLPCDVDCLLRGIYVEIHQIASASKENAECRRKSGGKGAKAQGLDRGSNGFGHWFRAFWAALGSKK